MYFFSISVFLFSNITKSIPNFSQSFNSSWPFKSTPKVISKSVPKKSMLSLSALQSIFLYFISSWTKYSTSAFKYLKSKVNDEMAHIPSTFDIP